MRNEMKNYEHEIDFYPSSDEILNTGSNHVPHVLKMFMDELVRAPLKQIAIYQPIISATRPKSVMPLQSGLAVAVDNRLASKWQHSTIKTLLFKIKLFKLRLGQNVWPKPNS